MSNYSESTTNCPVTGYAWAIFALQAGKSIRWVADQLGHADPALTLRVYVHAMLDEEIDLPFSEFGGPDGRIRPLSRKKIFPNRVTA